MSSPLIKDGEKEKKKKRILKSDSSPNVPDNKKPKIIDNAPSREFHISQFYAEEEEAAARNPEKDLEIFKAACGNIRQAIVDIRQQKTNKDENFSDIENKKIDASLQFVVLKKLNRLSHFRCRKMREATAEAKQRIDQYHLQLQNLLYEAMHLQKEITKCLEFKSKDEEIELIDVEEFYKEAPAQISKPKITKNDPHQLTLARLDWELEQRKQLATKLKESQSNKETITQEITTKEEYLESLQPKLASILQATKPVQNYLGMPYDEIREQHQTAYHLPHPLYVLYMQSSAFQEACDKHLKVTIEGDVEAAKSSNSSATAEMDEESDSEEEQESKKSKRRRKTVEARQIDKKERVLRKHPLSVILDITCKDGSCLKLTFNYLVLLHIITVSIKVIPSGDAITSSISGGDLLAAESILNELYPGDYGNTSPNQANHFELKRLGMEEFTHYISHVGRPYMWAQWLGGLQFLSDGQSDRAKSSVSASHMQETIKQLRRRIRARLSLLKQLASLEKSIIPVSTDCIKMFPAKIFAQVTSWKRTTYEDFACLTHAAGVMENGLVKETDMFFTVVMERGSARLIAQVVVTPDYPAQPPLFVVTIWWKSERTAKNDIHVQELEEEVNVYYEELVQSKSHGQLLSNQIQRLLMCFDVYLETESHDMSSPLEIPKEKVFPRTSRGPNRKKPYKYVPDLGIFTQR